MALLVCFQKPNCEVDWSKRAIYLDQSFYGLLIKYFKKHHGESVLKRIVAIGYGDELFIGGSQLESAMTELERIIKSGEVSHPQAQLFSGILGDAISRRCGLAVAGDMFPDLSNNFG